MMSKSDYERRPRKLDYRRMSTDERVQDGLSHLTSDIISAYKYHKGRTQQISTRYFFGDAWKLVIAIFLPTGILKIYDISKLFNG